MFEKPEDLRKFLASNLNIGNSATINVGSIELKENGEIWLSAKDKDGVLHEREL